MRWPEDVDRVVWTICLHDQPSFGVDPPRLLSEWTVPMLDQALDIVEEFAAHRTRQAAKARLQG